MSLSGIIRMIVSGIGPSVDGAVAVAGTGAVIIDESIADEATDQLVDCAFDLQRLTAFYMLSDQAITVKTNSQGTPQETLSLVADKPFVYIPGAGIPSPFADDVTALYVTNASGSAARLQIRALLDVTP